MAASEAEIDPAAEEKRLQEIFDEIDEDHSHTLERQEIQHLAERMGHPLSEAELDTAMAELDTNGSGHVKFQEFRSWYLAKHSEAGEHSAVLKLVEEEAKFNPFTELAGHLQGC